MALRGAQRESAARRARRRPGPDEAQCSMAVEFNLHKARSTVSLKVKLKRRTLLQPGSGDHAATPKAGGYVPVAASSGPPVTEPVL